MYFNAERHISADELLSGLRKAALIDEAGAARIADHLARQKPERGESLFIQALLAAGAWAAAFCLLLSLSFTFTDLINSDLPSLFFWGGGLLTVAVGLRHLTRSVFPIQLALALSMAGHALIIWAGSQLAPLGSGTAITALLLALVLYPLYPDALHRFLSCLAASICVTDWIWLNQAGDLLHAATLAKVVIMGIAFMYRPDLQFLRPLGYAMAVSVPASLMLVLLPAGILDMHWWPANVVMAAALIWFYQWAAGGWRQLRREPLVLAVVATICLACVTTPGVLAALGLLMLGYARRDAILIGIGAAFFPAFLVIFYYEMEVSLLIKSYILMSSGAVLLAARWYLIRRGWTRESSSVVGHRSENSPAALTPLVEQTGGLK